MNARPDFSPEMLRGFLYARAVARDSFARNPRLARAELVAVLMQASGLPFSVVRAAFIGRPIDDAQRAALWAALGHPEAADA